MMTPPNRDQEVQELMVLWGLDPRHRVGFKKKHLQKCVVISLDVDRCEHI